MDQPPYEGELEIKAHLIPSPGAFLCLKAQAGPGGLLSLCRHVGENWKACHNRYSNDTRVSPLLWDGLPD